MLPRLALPPSHAVLLLIALAFVAPGLVGHDPWRAFDVIAIEIVQQMHLSGDWVVPRIAGEAWLEDPPFYHWLALACAKVFGGLLGFHNAVRLASGTAMFAALWFLYLAARHSEIENAPCPEARGDFCDEFVFQNLLPRRGEVRKCGYKVLRCWFHWIAIKPPASSTRNGESPR